LTPVRPAALRRVRHVDGNLKQGVLPVLVIIFNSGGGVGVGAVAVVTTVDGRVKKVR